MKLVNGRTFVLGRKGTSRLSFDSNIYQTCTVLPFPSSFFIRHHPVVYDKDAISTPMVFSLMFFLRITHYTYDGPALYIQHGIVPRKVWFQVSFLSSPTNSSIICQNLSFSMSSTRWIHVGPRPTVYHQPTWPLQPHPSSPAPPAPAMIYL